MMTIIKIFIYIVISITCLILECQIVKLLFEALYDILSGRRN